MKLRETFIHYFIPHKANTYKPHFLRVKMASGVVLVILALFALSVAAERTLIASSSSEVAAVIAAALVDLANSDRAQQSLLSLTVSPELQAAAQAKADDMAANGYFAHVSPSGRNPWYWFTQAGYAFSYGGENLAVYFSDSHDVNTAWMNSPEHRANILNGHFTQIGVATADGMYQGHETTFVVQEFGTPAGTEASTKQPVAPALAKSQKPVAVTQKGTPNVAGASIAVPPVKVIAQDKNFIAVENENVPAPAVAQAATAASKPNPVSAFMLRFVTSPESDLAVAYEIIGAIIILALVLEIFVEMRRVHPHRIVLGLSLIGLMAVLLVVGHTFMLHPLIIV